MTTTESFLTYPQPEGVSFTPEQQVRVDVINSFLQDSSLRSSFVVSYTKNGLPFILSKRENIEQKAVVMSSEGIFVVSDQVDPNIGLGFDPFINHVRLSLDHPEYQTSAKPGEPKVHTDHNNRPLLTTTIMDPDTPEHLARIRSVLIQAEVYGQHIQARLEKSQTAGDAYREAKAAGDPDAIQHIVQDAIDQQGQS